MKPSTISDYEILDENIWLKHRYGDGATKLAIKLLKKSQGKDYEKTKEASKNR
jgi:hypothetical protein